MADIIICKSCGFNIDLNVTPEECMGFTRCPNCKLLVDNEGKPVKQKKKGKKENFFTNFLNKYNSQGK